MKYIENVMKEVLFVIDSLRGGDVEKVLVSILKEYIKKIDTIKIKVIKSYIS